MWNFTLFQFHEKVSINNFEPEDEMLKQLLAWSLSAKFMGKLFDLVMWLRSPWTCVIVQIWDVITPNSGLSRWHLPWHEISIRLPVILVCRLFPSPITDTSWQRKGETKTRFLQFVRFLPVWASILFISEYKTQFGIPKLAELYVV